MFNRITCNLILDLSNKFDELNKDANKDIVYILKSLVGSIRIGDVDELRLAVEEFNRKKVNEITKSLGFKNE